MSVGVRGKVASTRFYSENSSISGLEEDEKTEQNSPPIIVEHSHT